MAVLIEYVKVPVLREEDPAAQLARQIIRLLDDSPRATPPGLPQPSEVTVNCYVTSCNVAPYITMDSREPSGVEIQCSIRLVSKSVNR